MKKKLPANKKKSVKKTDIVNVFFCGTGGQGVLTAAEICALAAMQAGFHVKKSEVHGMAQRGGSVESHVRFGTQVFSPLIEPGNADYLVCFHQGEGRRLSGYCKKKGVNFTGLIDEPRYRPADARFGNTFYLGMLSAWLSIDVQTWHNAIRATLKRALPENLAAFDQGRSLALPLAGGTKA